MGPGPPVILHTAVDQVISQENAKKVGIANYYLNILLKNILTKILIFCYLTAKKRVFYFQSWREYESAVSPIH
ncbi:MAG: hypothetical protein C4567_06485 [Deltaproteobacteria bacterium]|nr:MAG: hypothetical protein C4567_06485 [Deltaproteobacteria bacterium]